MGKGLKGGGGKGGGGGLEWPGSARSKLPAGRTQSQTKVKTALNIQRLLLNTVIEKEVFMQTKLSA